MQKGMKQPSKDDESFMRLALREARKGRGRTSPNPLVGAIVVKNGEIVGKGFHKKAGTPHAEVHALRDAGEKAEGATIYVTLEPCAMCAAAMVHARIARLVFGAVDPKGGGVVSKYNIGRDGLLNHHFSVTGGVLQEKCSKILRDFFQKRR